ncbi:MAG TPA: hypothetical protein VK174_17825 [Chitinophagales bacterium]|nr:hypothetical protein [Chitinophagales bacterium]
MYRYLLLLLLISSACHRDKKLIAPVAEPSVANNNWMQPDSLPTGWHKLNKLFITGDFDGNGKADTLREGMLLQLTHTEIDSVPDSLINSFETSLRWYDKQKAEVYVAFTKPNHDTLFLGNAAGLYCLINLGDLNKDGKDDIALSRDNLDFSNVGSCHFYTLCKGQWIQAGSIQIHESAFDLYVGDSISVFKNVPGFLEKQNGQWYYEDYLEQNTFTSDTPPVRKKLVIRPCEKL